MSGYAKDRPADDSPFERMRYYIRETGQGPKAARDLTRDEARDAMETILRQEATHAQIGGFLLIERFKGESPEELLGFADAVRAHATRISPKVDGLLDIGSPYDGRRRSLVVSPAASIVACAAGLPVVMHGEKDVGPKHGVPAGDVLEALGVDVDAGPEEVESSIEEVGFGYMRSARFVPDLFALKDVREEIALRSGLHTVEKLYNLAGAAYSLIGLTHMPYVEKMLAAATQMGFKRVMIVQGIEGNEDAPTSRPCRVFEWSGGEMRESRLDPGQYELAPASPEAMAGGDAAYNAGACEAVLEGEGGPRRDLVCLNAGLRLYLAERAADVAEGIAKAREAIDSGAARGKLEALRERARARAAV
ncbi:MAG TPA: anthranilate phosphoribosyltransferase [Dehalococcoidia bacterium]|nr:anthranilate phosphoribosyltransferase [Dehalococcoidia bacterium]